MPKDAKKNVDRYKIRGGALNEYEFSQNQARVKESFPGSTNSPMPMRGSTPKDLMEEKAAAKQSAKETAKESAPTKKSATTKKAAKKTTAKKAAKKPSKPAKKTAKKSTKKSAKK